MENIIITENEIQFPGFDTYLAKCHEVSLYIEGVELTESNEKEVRKILADARKLTNRLEEERKVVKKIQLAPYEVFAGQVKELTGIVSDAERILRDKVNELDEERRLQKKADLLELFNKRKRGYTFMDIVPDAFERWVKPQHLNKTYQMNKAEKDMVDFLEATQGDYDAIINMNDADILTTWSESLDLAKATIEVSARRKKEEVASDVLQVASFMISGESNIKFAEKFLIENSIPYTRK